MDLPNEAFASETEREYSPFKVVAESLDRMNTSVPGGFYKKGKKQYYGGFPYRGPALNLKEEDPDWMRPTLKYDYHVNVFDLSNEKELKKYEEVCQKVADKVAQISVEERKWCEASSSWKVLIRWCDVFYTVPNIELEFSKEQNA
jgi:hypothetical protein